MMSNGAEHKQYATRAPHSGFVAMNAPTTPLAGGSLLDGPQPARFLNLQAIDDYIMAEGLTHTLDQLPEPTSYTFAISDDKSYFDERKLLFLGGTDSFQVWARLKTYISKPDEVEFVHHSFLSHQSRAAHDLSRLPINMYPFRLLTGDKDKLTVLVRYVLSEAGGIDRPFLDDAKNTFKSALADIGEAIDKAGGVETLLNIHSPDKLPKGFMYMESLPSADIIESEEVSDHFESEVEVHPKVDEPSERRIFEVPQLTSKNKKSKLKMKLKPKPRALPRAVTEQDSPARDPATAVQIPSVKPDEKPNEPKPRRMAKPKPKPILRSKAATKKAVLAKRTADQAGLDEEDGYTELTDLEVERKEIEEEQARISERQIARQLEEKEDAERMKELEAQTKRVEKEEGKLLKGKSAAWLLAYQRQQKKP